MQASTEKYGYSSTSIANSINKAIGSGLLVGVNHVEPMDINVKENQRAVGVYYTPLQGNKSCTFMAFTNKFI